MKGLRRDRFPIGAEPIHDRLRPMGEAIMREFEALADSDGIVRITVVIVLKGAFIFASDLIRQFKDIHHEPHRRLECNVEFIIARSRPTQNHQNEVVLDLGILNPAAIEGKHVLIVEDIFDSGWTLEKIVGQLKTYGPRTLKIAVLLDKPSRRHAGCTIQADYTAFEIPNVWVVGYGLDEGQLYRNLPFIDVYDVERGGPRTFSQ